MCSEQPAPPAKPGPVLEDARALVRAGLPVAVLVLRDPAGLRPHVVVLPDVRREPRHVPGDPLLVVLVREVGAQRAAPVVRAARLDALAPLPKMQFQREVSHVRSHRKICSSSAGSGNSTHARAKSSPFSSASGLLRLLAARGFFACEEPLGGFGRLSSFAFFVFGTRPG